MSQAMKLKKKKKKQCFSGNKCDLKSLTKVRYELTKGKFARGKMPKVIIRGNIFQASVKKS